MSEIYWEQEPWHSANTRATARPAHEDAVQRTLNDFGDLHGPLAYWGPVAPARKRQRIRVSALVNPNLELAPVADLVGPLY